MTELLPISFPCGPAWHVAYTDARGEFRAQQQVRSLDFEAFLPVGRRRSHRRGETVINYAAMPRYLFVKFDPNKDDWGQIRQCWDVIDLLRVDGIPIRVQPEVMDGLLELQRSGFFDEKIAKGLEPGDMVRVIKGPFSELVGRFLHATRQQKIKILFDFLGKVELPLVNVVKA